MNQVIKTTVPPQCQSPRTPAAIAIAAPHRQIDEALAAMSPPPANGLLCASDRTPRKRRQGTVSAFPSFHPARAASTTGRSHKPGRCPCAITRGVKSYLLFHFDARLPLQNQRIGIDNARHDQPSLFPTNVV